MILQSLDIENNCKGIYKDGRLMFSNLKDAAKSCSVSWKHSNIIENDQNFEYLFLRLRNADLKKYSSNPDKYKKLRDLLSAHAKAAATAKVSLQDVCFYDLLPTSLLEGWYGAREDALRNLYKNTARPQDYEILHKIHVLTTEISRNSVLFEGSEARVIYDIFGTSTGRLSNKRGSLPILTLSKEKRKLIKPSADLFLEIDINAAEIRTLLALSGHQQPNEDIHAWNSLSCAPWFSRDQVKEQFFAWLYNPHAKNEYFEKIYNKQIYEKYYDGEKIRTPFGREIPVEKRKALNYLIQSTTSDIVLENVYKIMRLLKDYRSKVAFVLHDSVVLDFCKEDVNLVREVKDTFEETRFGKYSSTIKLGKNFGNMKEMQV